MLGMDTEEVLRYSDSVRRAEGTLHARLGEVDGTISGLDSFWRGSDAEEVHTVWSTVRDHAAASLLEHLRRAADELSGHVDDQVRASAADGGGVGAAQPGADLASNGGPPAPLPSLPGVAFDPGDGVMTTNDPAIQAAWEDMSEDDRRAVLAQIVEDEVAAYGMNAGQEFAPVDVEVRFFPGFLSGGAISLETGMIYLSSDLLDSPYGLQIAAHEARHQVQYELIHRTAADPWDWITAMTTARNTHRWSKSTASRARRSSNGGTSSSRGTTSSRRPVIRVLPNTRSSCRNTWTRRSRSMLASGRTSSPTNSPSRTCSKHRGMPMSR